MWDFSCHWLGHITLINHSIPAIIKYIFLKAFAFNRDLPYFLSLFDYFSQFQDSAHPVKQKSKILFFFHSHPNLLWNLKQNLCSNSQRKWPPGGLICKSNIFIVPSQNFLRNKLFTWNPLNIKISLLHLKLRTLIFLSPFIYSLP